MSESVDTLAQVGFSCGRYYLSVAGIVVAMEGDLFRGELPEDVLEPIPADELARATIGGVPASDLSIVLVRSFRGERWTQKMLRYVAQQINTRVEVDHDATS